LHELATNAAKYGALSSTEGRVSIRWSLETDCQSPRLKLHWQEMGGPKVDEPSRKGFGSRLIEKLLAAELGGKAKLSYDRGGVVYELDAAIESGCGHEAADGSF
jgi:two-component sensor histidine kinase